MQTPRLQDRRVPRWVGLLSALLTALIWLTPATEAWSQDMDAAREAFGRGNEAYNTGDYDAAIRYFEQANSIVPNARLLLYIGQCHMHLGHGVEALDYLSQYADTSSEAAREVRDIIGELERARGEVFVVAQRAVDSAWRLAAGEPPSGANENSDWTGIPVVPVRVTSVPPGAQVFIDDEQLGSVGRTPLTTELFAGPHHIIIKAEHYETHRERVDLQRGGTSVQMISAVLARANVPVTIRFNPVSVHGYYLTSAGDTIDLGTGSFRGELPSGEGVFILQRSGQSRRIERALGSESGGPVELTLNLNPRDDQDEASAEDMGILIIRSSQPGVVITLDGEEVGRGEGEFESQQSAGLHTIRVTQPGHETVIENLRVYPGERASWTVPRMYPQ